MEMRTAAATVKSQDGVGNDWFGRNKRAVGPFVLGFFSCADRESNRGKPTGKKTNLKWGIYFFLRLAFAWQGLAGLDSSGKRANENTIKNFSQWDLPNMEMCLMFCTSSMRQSPPRQPDKSSITIRYKTVGVGEGTIRDSRSSCVQVVWL